MLWKFELQILSLSSFFFLSLLFYYMFFCFCFVLILLWEYKRLRHGFHCSVTSQWECLLLLFCVVQGRFLLLEICCPFWPLKDSSSLLTCRSIACVVDIKLCLIFSVFLSLFICLIFFLISFSFLSFLFIVFISLFQFPITRMGKLLYFSTDHEKMSGRHT